MRRAWLLLVLGCAATPRPAPVAPAASQSRFEQLAVVSAEILALTFVDGAARHETAAGRGSDGEVRKAPLDLQKAARPDAYTISSPDDPAYARGRAPLAVGRKSKGAAFLRAPHGQYPVLMSHEVFLRLPSPMKPGKHYQVSVGDLARERHGLRFDERETRSLAMHVTQLGFVPSATSKYAYVSAWLGELGAFTLKGESRFQVLDEGTRAPVLGGQPRLRAPRDRPDSGRPDERASGTFAGADVWELDLSPLRRPGRYFVSVSGVGRSFPFQVHADVYRPAFRAVARAMYHQRCGTALTAPHTRWTRPLCHHPSLRPSERGMRQTTHRQLDGRKSDGDPHAAALTTGEVRAVWGGWHDAADWDREAWHPDIPNPLLLVYGLAPQRFTDGELEIPESGNGLPDIVDEARWGVDHYVRLQRADGGVSVGLFESGWPRPGETSATDSLDWFVYAEDPRATYKHAAAAARLAWTLEALGRESQRYVESAVRAYAWAERHTREADVPLVRDDRCHAAAAPFKATGEDRYHDAFRASLAVDDDQKPLAVWGKWDQRWAAWTYVTTERAGVDPQLRARLLRAAVRLAHDEVIAPARRRAGRLGYAPMKPAFWGQATIPQTLPAIVVHALTGDASALEAQQTSADYLLGGNPMDMVWVTGLGARSPRWVMHYDSWWGTRPDVPPGVVIPGLIPFGPHRHTPAERPPQGPWDPAFALARLHPPAERWPLHELWFENKHAPATNEFTVDSLAVAAAAYGYLSGDVVDRQDAEKRQVR